MLINQYLSDILPCSHKFIKMTIMLIGIVLFMEDIKAIDYCSDPDYIDTDYTDTLPDYCHTGHEYDIWYLGKNGLDFRNGKPTVIKGFNDNNSMWAGSYASICDKNGNLLLYTDHQYIYNRFHRRITNPLPFIGRLMRVYNIVIVSQPGQDSIIYFFSTDGVRNADDIKNLWVTSIDVNGNNGEGKVVVNANLMVKGSSTSICATRHCNGRDWWIVGQQTDEFGENFYAWLLTDQGIDIANPVISPSTWIADGRKKTLFNKYLKEGQLKISPDGRYLAEVTSITSTSINSVELYDFNASSGLINNGKLLYHASPTGVVCDTESFDGGVLFAEFSPDGSKLYYGATTFWQYDMDGDATTSICDNTTMIHDDLAGILNGEGTVGNASLGRDGKIYMQFYFHDSMMHVIHHPNLRGTTCQFEYKGLNRQVRSDFGMPYIPGRSLWPDRLFIRGALDLCQDTIALFQLSDPCPHEPTIWSALDGATIMAVQGDSASAYFAAPGDYRITAAYQTPCAYKTDTFHVSVRSCGCHQDINWSRIDTVVCSGETARFEFSSTASSISINGQSLSTQQFELAALSRDTCINLRLSYPRYCDSTIQLCIRVIPLPSIRESHSICSGDSILLDGRWWHQDTTFIEQRAQVGGCDSIIHHRIHFKSISQSTSRYHICNGDSILINGKYYNNAGTYTSHFTNIDACDSIATFIIDFYPNTIAPTQEVSFCANDSININNRWVHRDTSISITLQNQYGCDSIQQIDIIQKPIYTNKQNIKRCYGDSVNYRGKYYHNTTSIKDTLQSIHSCDSIINIDITIYPKIDTTIRSYIICPEDSVYINGRYYHQATDIINTLLSVHQCDSIIVDQLRVHPKSPASKEIKMICPGDSVLINQQWYYDTSSIYQHYSNHRGCDSIHTIGIIYNPNTPMSRLQFTICYGDSIQIYESIYKQDIHFSTRHTNPNGNCDSLIEISINVLDKLEVDMPSDITLSQGESSYMNPKYSPDITQYRWSPNNGLSCADCPNPIITAIDDREYKLIVSDQNSCEASYNLRIKIKKEIKEDQLYIPNVFSPNGDKLNDIWTVMCSNTNCNIQSIAIYDRWGGSVFQSNGHASWDGTSRGHALNPGVYTYIIRWRNSQNKNIQTKGDISLIR